MRTKQVHLTRAVKDFGKTTRRIWKVGDRQEQLTQSKNYTEIHLFMKAHTAHPE